MHVLRASQLTVILLKTHAVRFIHRRNMCKSNALGLPMPDYIRNVLSISRYLRVDNSPAAAPVIVREGRRSRVHECGDDRHFRLRGFLEKIYAGGVRGPIVHSGRNKERLRCTPFICMLSLAKFWFTGPLHSRRVANKDASTSDIISVRSQTHARRTKQ